MLHFPTQTIPQTHVVSTLSHLRQERQQATDGGNLLGISGNIGLILVDLIHGFRLIVEDQRQVPGDELFFELSDFLYLSIPK